jgi:hypothetical protein
MARRRNEQSLDEYFQPPEAVPSGGRGGGGGGDYRSGGELRRTDHPLTQPSVRSQQTSDQLRAVRSPRGPAPRSFHATNLLDQQTAPRPFLPGPVGRKGRMLLGAGFEPPRAGYFDSSSSSSRNNGGNGNAERRRVRHAFGLRRWRDNAQRPVGWNGNGNGNKIISVVESAARRGTDRHVDQSNPQFFAPAQSERYARVKQLMARQQASPALGSPRCQDPAYGSWKYRDRTLARYQNYPRGRDVPDPRRPMARTEAELRRPLTPIEHTSLYRPSQPRQRQNAATLVSPRVQQSMYDGGFQARMLRAQACVERSGDVVMRGGCGGGVSVRRKTGSRSNNVPNSSSSSSAACKLRIAIPLYGPREVAGRVRLKGPTPVPRVAPRMPEPRQIPQGPIRGNAPALPSPPVLHDTRFGWGTSREHGRPGRVVFS